MPTAINFDFGRGHARLQNIKTLLEDTKELAVNHLRVTGVVAADQTVTIGADVLQLIELDQDSGDDTGGVAGDFNNTDDPLLVVMAIGDYPALSPDGGSDSIAVGDLIRVETEIMRCTEIVGNSVGLQRGYSDTTNATHADANDIQEQATAAAAATTIRTGLDGTVFTAAAATDKILADYNQLNTENVRLVDIDTATLMAVAETPGLNLDTPTTEVMTNGAWDTVTLISGAVSGRRHMVAITHVPTAAEVSEGIIRIPVAFDPVHVNTQVLVTASGLEKRVIIAAGDVQAWDGATVITVAAAGNPAFVNLDNTGVGADWAATDTIHILITG